MLTAVSAVLALVVGVASALATHVEASGAASAAARLAARGESSSAVLRVVSEHTDGEGHVSISRGDGMVSATVTVRPAIGWMGARWSVPCRATATFPEEVAS